MKQTILIVALFFLYGCANKQPVKTNKLGCCDQPTSYSVVGEGIAPSNTLSKTHAMALAKRAAIADAYRQLGEKIYGIRVSASENVSNAILINSRIKTQVEACLKNAQITDNSYKQGLYRVSMSISVKSNGSNLMCSN